MKNPKLLFLIDGLGALLSAVLLFVLPAVFETIFGMPVKTTNLLALAAVAFACYSLCCHLFLPRHWKPYLLLIALANTLYGCVTIALVVYHYQSITVLGQLYFAGELMVIGVLVFVEFSVSLGKDTH